MRKAFQAIPPNDSILGVAHSPAKVPFSISFAPLAVKSAEDFRPHRD